jgi:tRNA(fMet)-specific endonuclease VapC
MRSWFDRVPSVYIRQRKGRTLYYASDAGYQYLQLHHQAAARGPVAAVPRLPSWRYRISAITLAELKYGAAKSARPRQNRQNLKEFVSALDVASFDIAATEAHGEIRASLEKSGRPIGAMDLLIAAHALSLGMRLATNNETEFKRVRGLRV